MNALEVAVTEVFGERCPDYDADCSCCIAWEAFDKSVRQRKLLDELVRAINDLDAEVWDATLSVEVDLHAWNYLQAVVSKAQST